MNLPPCSRGGGVGQRGSVGGVHGAEGSLSWFGNVRVGAYRTRRCRRDGVCPTWPKLHSLSQPSRLREWLRAETRKVQPSRRISARKPRYPTGKGGVAGSSRSEWLPDLGILFRVIIQPEAKRRNGAFIVGYLGFRAEISSNRCTNCSRKTSLEGSRLDSQRIKYLIDVRRFCRSLPVRCQNADERISVAPGQKTAAFSSHFVFGCLSQKPAHIGLKVIKDGSCRRGQQSPICEDSLPPSVRLNSSKARVADCRGRIRDPGGALGLTYRRHLSMRSRLSKRRGCAVCPRVATTRRPLIPLPQRPARGYETPLVTGSDAG